jgi:CheY-like chemotaxis protein
MPAMDGFEVAEQIRQDPKFAELKMVLLTSGGLRGDALRCRKLGISAYLPKPIKQSELFDALMGVLGSHPGGGPAAPLVTHHQLRKIRKHYRILLAEDNAVNQKVAVRMLEKNGHSVVVANNGHEALQELGREAFDIVLMDVQMPEMNGFEATAAIREEEKGKGRHIPIIALTAHAIRGDEERCLKAGMDAYVSKPIQVAKLFETIDRLLSSRPKGPEGEPIPERRKGDVLEEAAVMAVADGDPKFLREITEAFVESSSHLLGEIKNAIAHGDGRTLERSAHSLKGAVSNFGAQRAVEAASLLEKLGSANHLARAEEVCRRLEAEIDQLIPALQDLSGERPS